MKYYVCCGLLKEIVLAGNPIHAAIKSFQRLSGPTILGGVFTISERGFDIASHADDEDTLITTEAIIRIMEQAASPFDEFENF